MKELNFILGSDKPYSLPRLPLFQFQSILKALSPLVAQKEVPMRVPVTEKYERNGWPSVERPDLTPPEGWSLPLIHSSNRVYRHRLCRYGAGASGRVLVGHERITPKIFSKMGLA